MSRSELYVIIMLGEARSMIVWNRSDLRSCFEFVHDMNSPSPKNRLGEFMPCINSKPLLRSDLFHSIIDLASPSMIIT